MLSQLGIIFFMRIFVAVFLAGLILSGSPAHAQSLEASKDTSLAGDAAWRLSVTPYVWALGIRGSVVHDNTPLGEVRLSPGNVLSSLKLGGMVVAQLSRGRLGLSVDAMYGELGDSSSTVVRQASLSSSTSTTLSIVTVAPTYRIYESAGFSLDGLAGVRFLQQSMHSTITSPQLAGPVSLKSSQSVTDVIVGLKGAWRLGASDYYVPFYLDVGAGERSSVTSQAYIGLGRSFKWGDLSVVVKNVHYQFNQSRNTLDLNLLGLAVGATFRF